MRNWMRVVLMIVVVAGCHPRYAPLDEPPQSAWALACEGCGGSGGLDSIRARILASIAARNYDQAREYLKLAANMADDEQARFEQMISAEERRLVPFLQRALPHIFKATEGHFPQDTAEARELIQTTVTTANFVGTRYGNAVYARTLETGIQVWAWVRDGTIREGGTTRYRAQSLSCSNRVNPS
jgi:hypothetical protein